jgi:hypothetical protein
MKAQAVVIGLKGKYKLPAPFSREIGRIVMYWAYYEHYLTRLIWKLLNLTPVESLRGLADTTFVVGGIKLAAIEGAQQGCRKAVQIFLPMSASPASSPNNA